MLINSPPSSGQASARRWRADGRSRHKRQWRCVAMGATLACLLRIRRARVPAGKIASIIGATLGLGAGSIDVGACPEEGAAKDLTLGRV